MRRLLRLLPFLLCALTTAVHSDDQVPGGLIGDYRLATPVCIFDSVARTTRCEGETVDRVILNWQSETTVQVKIEFELENGRQCKVDTLGTWQRDHLLVEAKSDTNNECEMKIYHQDSEITLKDPVSYCARLWCSANATFNDKTLKRRVR